jgi:hypothetical protein
MGRKSEYIEIDRKTQQKSGTLEKTHKKRRYREREQ